MRKVGAVTATTNTGAGAANQGTVRALFDFDAAHSSELSFRKGDVWTVTRKNVGAGWWEGEKDGVLGLFPRNHVELIEEDTSESDSDPETGSLASSSSTSLTASVPPRPAFNTATLTPGQLTPSSSASSLGTSSPTDKAPIVLERPSDKQRSGTTTSLNNSVTSRAGSPNAGFLGAPEDYMVLDEHGRWNPSRQVFTLFVTNPEKRKKFSGVTSYMTYTIKTSLNSEVVTRRFKHFLWLHDRLTEKYPFVVIPSLPDKQLQGRFETQFVENRMRKLERFLNRVVQHPMLRSSAVLHHFITSSDVKEWKEGKRREEAEACVVTTYLDRLKIPDACIVDTSYCC